MKRRTTVHEDTLTFGLECIKVVLLCLFIAVCIKLAS